VDRGKGEGSGQENLGSADRSCGVGGPALAADDALCLGNNIPSQLAPGEIRSVYVTMKNNGATTWLRDDGYILGRFGDAGQFISSDIAIVGSTPWPPGYAYGFTLTTYRNNSPSPTRPIAARNGLSFRRGSGATRFWATRATALARSTLPACRE